MQKCTVGLLLLITDRFPGKSESDCASVIRTRSGLLRLRGSFEPATVIKLRHNLRQLNDRTG